MDFRDTIKKIIKEQGVDAIKKTSLFGLMDDYGAFADEPLAVKEIFKKLSQNGYVEKISLLSNKDKSWKYDVEDMIFDISNKFGYQKTMIADVLKEIAYGVNLISSEKDWSGIAENPNSDQNALNGLTINQLQQIAKSLNSVQTSSGKSSSATTSSLNSSAQNNQKKKSFWSFLRFGSSEEFKIKKYVDDKTGFIKPKLDQLSLSAKISEFEQIANANSAEANYLLGLIYYEGKGVTVDYKKAFAYFKNAANAGYSYAQNMLGLCFEKGKGTSVNTNEAAQWYYKAASQKLRFAIKNLGLLYHNTGNDQEALIWLKKAADDAEAMFLMAEIYYRGKPGIKNDKEAFKYYSGASAMHHHLQSTYMLGVLISQGHGVEQNQDYAAKFFQKAAEKGHVEAQYKLGCYYWEKYRAHIQQHPFNHLSSRTDENEEAFKNQAYYWLKKAKDNGHMAAKDLFNRIVC